MPEYIKKYQNPDKDILPGFWLFLFPRATSQVAMLAWIFDDCREGQIPHCLQQGIQFFTFFQ